MFGRDYTFKGRHASIINRLTIELDSELKISIFERNVDVLLIAPIVGLLYGEMSEVDTTKQEGNEGVKKIAFDQLSREQQTIEYNYQLIMMLHEKDKISLEERVDRAFKYANGSDERNKCDKIYESYVLGGIDILERKILRDSVNTDDYLSNIFNFLTEYNNKYETDISEEEIFNLCNSSEYE